MERVNLCDYCKRRKEDKCKMYRKNPNVVTVDCGMIDPDESLNLDKALEIAVTNETTKEG